MKITKLLFGFACASLIVPMATISAKSDPNTPTVETQPAVDEQVDEMFDTFDSSKKVLQLPDGGFVQGTITEFIEVGTVGADQATVTVYNSETDANALSIEAAKEKVREDAKNMDRNVAITPRGADIPTATRILGSGSSYKSAIFTASGWRVSDVKYKPSDGTGVFLRWASFVDSGRAGNAAQARSCISGGTLLGIELSPGYPDYVDSTDWTMYFTYNPIYGTQYEVANI